MVAEEHRDRRSEWWRRATWAFERTFSSDDMEAALGWKMLDTLLQSKLATRGDSEIVQVIGQHPPLDEVEDLGTTWKRGVLMATTNASGYNPRSRRRVVVWLYVRPLPARSSPPARRPGVPRCASAETRRLTVDPSAPTRRQGRECSSASTVLVCRM